VQNKYRCGGNSGTDTWIEFGFTEEKLKELVQPAITLRAARVQINQYNGLYILKKFHNTM
jgi:threonine synthase